MVHRGPGNGVGDSSKTLISKNQEVDSNDDRPQATPRGDGGWMQVGYCVHQLAVMVLRGFVI